MKELINIIEKYIPLISTNPDWNDKKTQPLKNQIRDFLTKKQSKNNGVICVYCRREIENHSKKIIDEHIEHILCKSIPEYKHLTFAPYNLAIACSSCNYNKSDYDIRGNVVFSKKTKNFDFKKLLDENFLKNKNGKYYDIIHPYYDDYDKNIEINNNCAYTIKENAPNYHGAKKMIEICKLMEIEEIEKRKKEIFKEKYINPFIQHLEDLQHRIRNNNIDTSEIDKEIELIKNGLKYI